MSELIQVPNNVPVSWLEPEGRPSDDALLLVSEPNQDTETQYMSRSVRVADFENKIIDDLDIPSVEGLAALSGYVAGTYYTKNNNVVPKVISAITTFADETTGRFGMQSVSAYNLSAGINLVFNKLKNDRVPVATVIPQLSDSTKSAPRGSVISSIVERGGVIQSVGYAPLPQLPDSTKSAPAGNVITSIVEKGGVIQSVGSVKIAGGLIPDSSAEVGAGQAVKKVSISGGRVTVAARNLSDVFYSDSSNSGSVIQPTQSNLYVMKLKYSQFQSLSASGGLRTGCIYLTTGDPEA